MNSKVEVKYRDTDSIVKKGILWGKDESFIVLDREDGVRIPESWVLSYRDINKPNFIEYEGQKLKLTDHAKLRASERFGTPHDHTHGFFEKILENGIEIENISGIIFHNSSAKSIFSEKHDAILILDQGKIVTVYRPKKPKDSK